MALAAPWAEVFSPVVPVMSALLGRWRLLRADAALDFAPDVRMDFLENGLLRYSFALGDTRQVVDLRYRVEGDILRTEVPGTTHEAMARIEFGSADALVVDFAGARAWFVREVTFTPHGTG